MDREFLNRVLCLQYTIAGAMFNTTRIYVPYSTKIRALSGACLLPRFSKELEHVLDDNEVKRELRPKMGALYKQYEIPRNNNPEDFVELVWRKLLEPQAQAAISTICTQATLTVKSIQHVKLIQALIAPGHDIHISSETKSCIGWLLPTVKGYYIQMLYELLACMPYHAQLHTDVNTLVAEHNLHDVFEPIPLVCDIAVLDMNVLGIIGDYAAEPPSRAEVIRRLRML